MIVIKMTPNPTKRIDSCRNINKFQKHSIFIAAKLHHNVRNQCQKLTRFSTFKAGNVVYTLLRDWK